MTRFERTGWKEEHPTPAVLLMIPNVQVWRKDVEDGKLTVLRSKEDGLWHMSISHPSRYPSWDEIYEARYEFLLPNIQVAMMLPPKEEYVNFHKHTFHLWERNE